MAIITDMFNSDNHSSFFHEIKRKNNSHDIYIMNINDIINLGKTEKENLLKETEEILVKSKINFVFNSVEGHGYITGIGVPGGNNTGYKETDLLLQYLLLKKW